MTFCVGFLFVCILQTESFWLEQPRQRNSSHRGGGCVWVLNGHKALGRGGGGLVPVGCAHGGDGVMVSNAVPIGTGTAPKGLVKGGLSSEECRWLH